MQLVHARAGRPSVRALPDSAPAIHHEPIGLVVHVGGSSPATRPGVVNEIVGRVRVALRVVRVVRHRVVARSEVVPPTRHVPPDCRCTRRAIANVCPRVGKASIGRDFGELQIDRIKPLEVFVGARVAGGGTASTQGTVYLTLTPALAHVTFSKYIYACDVITSDLERADRLLRQSAGQTDR